MLKNLKKKEIIKTQPIPEIIKINKHKIDCENFEITLHNYLSESTNRPITDTIFIYEALGFNLDNILLEIKPKNKSDQFEIHTKYSQEIMVYRNERLSERLVNWTKTSQEIKLVDSLNYYYRTPYYSYDLKEKELKNDFEQIKKDVLQLTGEFIKEELHQSKSLKELPVELWLNKIFIKITRIDEKGNKEETIIVNESSWGC